VKDAPASLTGSLLRRKVAATLGFLPTDEIDADVPIVIAAAPTLLRRDSVLYGASRHQERAVRQSVPLDRDRHLRLKLAATKLQSSARQLMVDALDHYLATVVPARLSGECPCLQPVAATRGGSGCSTLLEPDP
jgi:hypothetical protein